MPSHGSEIVTLYTATWKDDRLVIVSTSTYPHGGTLQQTQIMSLDPKGQLVVEIDAQMTGRPKETSKIVYVKK